MILNKENLKKLYLLENKSVSEIAKKFRCSSNKIDYWIKKFKIKKRSISEAIYLKHNPNGDPFKIKNNFSKEEEKLFGLGIGLYWGEGNKANKSSIRLGNSDPNLINKFIEFLDIIYGIDKKKLRFSLQIFSDLDSSKVLNFWINELKTDKNQFQKVVITPKRGEGAYKKKSQYGVLIVYYHNKKLRDIICNEIKNLL